MSVHLNLYLYRKPNKGILFSVYKTENGTHYQINEQNNIWIMHNEAAQQPAPWERTAHKQVQSQIQPHLCQSRAHERTHARTPSTDETKVLCARYNIIKRTNSTESI